MERRVVITGLGAVTPVGLTAPDTWAALKAGTCGVGPITQFDTEGYKVTVAAEVKGFDPVERGLSKQEAKRNDLATQYVLVASDEAVADAGLVIEGSQAATEAPEGEEPPAANIAAERVGTYVGSGIGGFHTNVEQIITCHEKGPRKVSPFMIPMMIANMACGARVDPPQRPGPDPARRDGLRHERPRGGRGLPRRQGTATATPRSWPAAPRRPSSPERRGRLHELHGARPRTPTPPRPAARSTLNRDGFVMGEGAVRARARGASSTPAPAGRRSTPRSWATATPPTPTTSRAPTPTRLGHRAAAIEQAVAEGGVKPEEGLYINAHGTSTKLNDACETAGLQDGARRAGRPRRAHQRRPRAMTGHMLGATGAMEAMACALALKEGMIPPDHRPGAPPIPSATSTTPRAPAPCAADVRWALSTNLGFGGHNAALALHR